MCEKIVKEFECTNIECGRVFQYGAVSLGKFVQPNYCPQCGSPDPKESTDEEPDTDRCRVCGKDIPAGDGLCDVCDQKELDERMYAL
jgi:hypothetical protein